MIFKLSMIKLLGKIFLVEDVSTALEKQVFLFCWKVWTMKLENQFCRKLVYLYMLETGSWKKQKIFYEKLNASLLTCFYFDSSTVSNQVSRSSIPVNWTFNWTFVSRNVAENKSLIHDKE